MRPLPSGAQAPAWLLGESAFTTVRTWDGVPLLWPQHLARLRGTCEVLGLPTPEAELPRLDTVGWGLLRVTVTAEGTFWSRRPLAPGPRPEAGVAVRLTGVQVHPQLAGHKTGSYLPYLLAGRAAAGAFEGWLTDGAGHVVDGGRTSPLLELDGRLVVPSGGLPGVTRAAYLTGHFFETRPVAVTELAQVTRAWICGSGVGVVPVRRLMGEGWEVDLPAGWPAVTDRALVWPGPEERPWGI
ncbi:aminotransferase class IV [Deinococcus sp. MIMF12]|uniref:Aminotransferase class IV n=1 Tax=Deinococcus rhizophilus TaxID=3049544 RepID=A0ABT7JI23_9DEIO|nr:aminotransferase class IV [Deinococcus rhizophilus]MDL2344713.1 aminotransferase class IV [Deinococcus rhizophilus]